MLHDFVTSERMFVPGLPVMVWTHFMQQGAERICSADAGCHHPQEAGIHPSCSGQRQAPSFSQAVCRNVRSASFTCASFWLTVENFFVAQVRVVDVVLLRLYSSSRKAHQLASCVRVRIEGRLYVIAMTSSYSLASLPSMASRARCYPHGRKSGSLCTSVSSQATTIIRVHVQLAL